MKICQHTVNYDTRETNRAEINIRARIVAITIMICCFGFMSVVTDFGCFKLFSERVTNVGCPKSEGL